MSVITFKPNDHTKITTDFERYEFSCPCGCTATWLCVRPGVYPSTTYNKFVLPTIEQGCEGAANRAATVMLQRLLGIPHDGSFGPATTKALMAAQRKHGLTPDGICGPKSWTVLSGADKYL